MNKILKPNRPGWVTSATITPEYHFVDTTSFGDNQRQYLPTSQSVRFSVEGMAVGGNGLFNIFNDWLHNGINEPIYQKEWPCLYCASPNSINKTHCTQCGAPRSFILG